MVGNYYTGNDADGNTKQNTVNWATEFNGKYFNISGEGEQIVPADDVMYDIPT